ncbi:cyclin-t1-4-like protein, partial [Trifolium pratense]
MIADMTCHGCNICFSCSRIFFKCCLGWLRSSLWLQFKPHQIAAGAAYLAAKFLNMDLAAYQNIWQEFQATPSILQ